MLNKTKKCTKCKIYKPRNKFYLRNKLKNWIFSECKPCADISRTRRREKQLGRKIKMGTGPKPYSEKEIKLATTLYNQGFAYNKILRYFPHRTQHAIESKLSEIGVATRVKYFRRRESSIENLVETWLKEYKLKYKKQVRVDSYVVDFLLRNIIIEVNGSYWHSDIREFPQGPKYNLQKVNVQKDKKKKKFLLDKGYNIIYIWEYDLEHTLKKVKDQLFVVLTSNCLDNKRGISVEILRDNAEIIDLIAKGKSTS
jgi:very-short-patch-repair endonuclease